MTGTLADIFQESVSRYPDMPALLGKTKGVYEAVTYQDMALRVRRMARGLLSLGVRKRDRVALLSENRIEWAISDMAIIHIGAVNVAVFPNIPASQAEYILSDSGSNIIIVSDRNQLKKALEIQNRLNDLRIIAMESVPESEYDITSLDSLERLGDTSPSLDTEFESRWKNMQPEDWASIIYTSGTTGDPKGVILTHGNFVFNIEAGKNILHFLPGEVLLSFVPLNHIMGRFADHYLPLSTGSTVAYVENLLRLRMNMEEVQPHYMLLVPRVLEMFHEGIMTTMTKESPLRQQVFRRALSIGRECCKYMENKQTVPVLKSLQWRLADRIVFNKIRSRLGLARLKFFFSGGAPLRRETAEFFGALKIRIMEGYGLSETAPLVAVNPHDLLKFGTVGPAVKGVEVKIAADGEILVRGPNVMPGYYNKPDDTAATIDKEGWLHTGDIGELDGDGYLTITDRKKDLIVLSNGKKVAPQPMENRLAASPYIAHIVVVGDKRSTLAALVVPAFAHLSVWTKARGIDGDPKSTAVLDHPEVQRLYKGEIDRLLPGLADFEKIRRFSLIGEELTVDNGLLTPTLKVRKRSLLERYAHMVEEMYR